MKSSEDEFFRSLKATFKVEASERAQKIALSLLDLEKSKNVDAKYNFIELIYRELHSLKSASRAVNINSIEKICQDLESMFSEWKTSKTFPEDKELDYLHQLSLILLRLIQNSDESEAENVKEANKANKILEDLNYSFNQAVKSGKIKKSKHSNGSLDNIKTNTKSENSPKKFDRIKNDRSNVESISERNKNDASEYNAQLNSEYARPSESLQDTSIRISSGKLDTLLLQSEELLSEKLNFSNRFGELIDLKSELLYMRHNLDKIISEKFNLKQSTEEKESENKNNNSYKKIFDYFTQSEKFLKNLSKQIDAVTSKFEQNIRSFSIGINNLLEDSKKLLLLPFSVVLNTMPLIVRDLSKSLGKKVNFNLEGSEIEIDKRILEEMKDVLIHLVRNSIDHGIESKEQRKLLGKPETGTLNLNIQHISGNEIQIEISDDGAGINIEKVKKSAISQNIISPKEAKSLNSEESLMLIYQSGVSTSEQVSDVSGRGLGMSIIREKIEKVGGRIYIQTEENEGTNIKLVLPLTLATYKGLLVRVSYETFIIPVSNLERIVRVSENEVKKVENRETMVYFDQVISLVWLENVLGLKHNSLKKREDSKLLVLILGSNEGRIGFVVDEIMNESEILVKNFTFPIIKIRNISAAAILGSGKPVPILNASDLIQMQSYSTLNRDSSRSKLGKAEKKKRVLLAEDSITTRMLLKNILELDGFHVITAVDGYEAWQKMNEEEFNLVISDIEMPRMDGFELTEKIRQDKKLKNTPIVIITSRESPKDRERGIDLGANAYVLKSSFDSKNLLEILKTLSH